MNWVIAFGDEFVTLFSEMAPFLLLGFLLAGVIHVWIPNHLYIPKISKPTFMSVLWAALFGVPLPICSCGVIPTSIAIRREGASKGASVSFLISTPATGVDSILATYSLLGLPFAVLRPIAAFVTALFGGVLTNMATRGEGNANAANAIAAATSKCCGDAAGNAVVAGNCAEDVAGDAAEVAAGKRGCGAEGDRCDAAGDCAGDAKKKCGCVAEGDRYDAAGNCAEDVAGDAAEVAAGKRGCGAEGYCCNAAGDCGCGGHECGCADHAHSAAEKLSVAERVKETFRYGFVDMVSNVSKWLCIGLVLGALIAAFVPNDFFLALREYPILCMLAVLVLAMPMYTCATGSIPLALALVAKGITPGAALVLLMAGPATSIASMLVVGKSFGKRTLAAYLASIAGGALFFGFIVDTFFMDTFLAAMLPDGAIGGAEMGHSAVGIFDEVCAVFLALLMIYSKLPFVAKKSHYDGCGCGCHEDEHCECGNEHCECGSHGECCAEDVAHAAEAEKNCGDSLCKDDDCCGSDAAHAAEAECCVETSPDVQTPQNAQPQQPTSKTYKVFGMSCSHCKACVEKAVFMLEGVVYAEANVAKKELYVEGSVDEAILKKTIEDAGFEYGGEA